MSYTQMSYTQMSHTQMPSGLSYSFGPLPPGMLYFWGWRSQVQIGQTGLWWPERAHLAPQRHIFSLKKKKRQSCDGVSFSSLISFSSILAHEQVRIGNSVIWQSIRPIFDFLKDLSAQFPSLVSKEFYNCHKRGYYDPMASLFVFNNWHCHVIAQL